MWLVLNRSLIALALLLGSASTSADCDEIFRGRYTWGAEVDSFRPCGSGLKYWVDASSWVQGPLIDFVREHTKEPYQPVYIEFRGHLLNEVLDGFAEGYDGLIRVSEIFLTSQDVPDKCA